MKATPVTDTQTTSASAALYQRALESLPGGVSRNTVLRQPHPLYVAHASGSRMTDIEGVERIDFANNMASLIHGHAHPAIVEAVTAQLQRGTAYAEATEIEVRFAEHLISRNPRFEKIRFVNSGTEAVMSALKASRAFTGRAKIAKVEGAYHGQYDYAEVSQNPTPENWGDVDVPNPVPVARGTPPGALADVVVIPYNDIDRALTLLDAHKGQLACVLLDLMSHRVGLRPADPEFVAAIRDWARGDGALIVLDEVITFRSAYGGAQTWYDLDPDLTALGKFIGGGFPVGALTGRAEVMNVMDPLALPVQFPHSGTFSANPITMTAGLTAMELFDEAAVEQVNALARRAHEGIDEAINATGIEACVTGGGSLLRLHMQAAPPHNYRDAFWDPEQRRRLTWLINYLLGEGITMINTCTVAMSTAHTDSDIDTLVATLERGFGEILAQD
jgi:glutamate-1-semialdehyde 2,1-aminomutase